MATWLGRADWWLPLVIVAFVVSGVFIVRWRQRARRDNDPTRL